MGISCIDFEILIGFSIYYEMISREKEKQNDGKKSEKKELNNKNSKLCR